MNIHCRLCSSRSPNYDDDLLCGRCSTLNRIQFFARIFQVLNEKASDFQGLRELARSLSAVIHRQAFQCNLCEHFNYFRHREDSVANQYLHSHCPQQYQGYVAVELSDSNSHPCFYECIMAIFEYIDPNLKMELRVRTYLELIENYPDYSTRISEAQTLPDFLADALLDKGQVPSAWDFLGMASILKVRIQSIYPFINGVHDEMACKFSTIFKPRTDDYNNAAEILLLWTNKAQIDACQSPWRPNTIVPLLKKHKMDAMVCFFRRDFLHLKTLSLALVGHSQFNATGKWYL